MVDAAVVKTAALCLLGVACLLRSVLLERRWQLHWSWYGVVVLYAAVVFHYLWVGYSVSSDTNVILAFGAALIAFAGPFRDAAEHWDSAARAPAPLGVAAGAFVASNLAVLVLRGEDAFLDGSLAGVTANPNMLGAYLVILCFPLLVDLATAPLGRSLKALAWSTLAVCVWLVFLTRSRAALLALLAASLVWLVRWARGSLQRKLGLVAAGGGASALVLAIAGAKYEDVDLFGTRTILLLQRLMAISERPWLGWGFNSSVYTAFDESNVFPSMEKGNTILQALEEFGIPLGSVVVAGVAWLAWRAVSTLGRTRRGTPFAGALVAGAVHLMFETWLFNFPSVLSTYFWTILLTVNVGTSLGAQEGPDGTPLKEAPPGQEALPAAPQEWPPERLEPGPGPVDPPAPP